MPQLKAINLEEFNSITSDKHQNYLPPILISDLGLIYFKGNANVRKRFGLFKCQYCDNTFKCQIAAVLSGNTKSCGCNKSNFIWDNRPHHKLTFTQIYKLWGYMNSRCQKSHKSKDNYFNRGITVCDEWKHNPIKFYEWALDNGHKNGLVIDRINNDLGYSPDNCRFVNRYINAQNTRLLSDSNNSGYRGVTAIDNKNNRWRARITSNGKKFSLGIYKTKIEAAIAYNNFIIQNNTCHPLNIV